MAVVLPLLILILFGIIEFGLIFNTQIALTQAAREGVRYEALGTGDAVQEAQRAFIALRDQAAVANLEQSCDGSEQARLTMTAGYSFIVLPASSVTLQGAAVMRCGG